MPTLNSLNLIIDVTDPNKAGIYIDFSSRLPASVPLFIRNDTIPVTLRFVTPNTSGIRAWDDVDLSTYDVTLGIGDFDRTPTSGTFPLTYGADTAFGLGYDISAASLQTSLNSLNSIQSAGGVTVTSPAVGQYIVTFVSDGAKSFISSTSNGLNPATTVIISRVVTGATDINEVQIIQLVVNPNVLNQTWEELPVAAAVVTEISPGSGSTQNVQQISLDPIPYFGTFQITANSVTTPAIDYLATAQQVQDALGGSGSYLVSGPAGGPWTITKVANGAIAQHTVNVSGLLVPVGLSGIVQLSTLAMLQRFLGEGNTIEQILEIQAQLVEESTTTVTVLQVPITVSKDVINLNALVPSPITNYYTAAQVNSIISALFSSSQTSPSTSGTTQFGPDVFCKFATLYVNAQTGSGTYTRNISLEAADRSEGDIVRVVLSMPASSNPTIVIKDDASAATLYTEINPGALAYNRILWFTFNGDNFVSDQ
jgi:hypothetical protein